MTAHASRMLAMYPGQGSQYTGMGRSLLIDFPYTKQTFEQIEDLMGMRIRHLCLTADREELMQTMHTQPCLFAVSLAYQVVLQEEVGFSPDLYAGHSLGEFSALTASGILPLETACRLVRMRGQVMQALVGKGGMLAVIGADLPKLADIVQQTSKESGEVIDLANFNSPQQVVVSGSSQGIQTLEQRLTQAEMRWIKVPVSAPFHSRLMQEAETELEELILAADFKENGDGVISNYKGEICPYQPTFLVKQISNPVRWADTIKTAIDYGCEVCVEIGSRKVLTTLLRSFPGWRGKSYPLDGNLKEFLQLLA